MNEGPASPYWLPIVAFATIRRIMAASRASASGYGGGGRCGPCGSGGVDALLVLLFGFALEELANVGDAWTKHFFHLSWSRWLALSASN